jgi:hypothetical protein
MVRIPPSWIAQTSNGGLVLANLYRDLGGGALVLLHVGGDQASGHFLPFSGGFMPTRTHPIVRGVDLLEAHAEDNVTMRQARAGTAVPCSDAFSMFAALRVPAQRVGLLPDTGPEQTWLLGRDGSWAYQTASEDGPVVVQGGPAKLWDMLDDACADWEALGRPPREAFGLSVMSTGEHPIWHEGGYGLLMLAAYRVTDADEAGQHSRSVQAGACLPGSADHLEQARVGPAACRIHVDDDASRVSAVHPHDRSPDPDGGSAPLILLERSAGI